MDFWTVIVGLVRRKALIIPLVASAVVVGLSGYFLTPPRYVSTTAMIMVPPAFEVSRDPTRARDVTNPMLNFSSNLKTATAILIYAMNTPEVAAQLGAPKGGPTEVTINDVSTNTNVIDSNGPFVYITGESTSTAEAKDVVIRAATRMRQELLVRQNSLGAPPETFLSLVDVVAPTVPKVTRSDRIKVGGIGSVLALVFGLGGAYAWERRRASRRGRLADAIAVLQENQPDSTRNLQENQPDSTRKLNGYVPTWDPPTWVGPPRQSIRKKNSSAKTGPVQSDPAVDSAPRWAEPVSNFSGSDQ